MARSVLPFCSSAVARAIGGEHVRRRKLMAVERAAEQPDGAAVILDARRGEPGAKIGSGVSMRRKCGGQEQDRDGGDAFHVGAAASTKRGKMPSGFGNCVPGLSG